MERHQVGAVGLVAMALLFPGCGDAKTPVQPTLLPSVGVTLREYSATGEVYDTAGRPLGGSRVEVIDGPRSGTVTTTDDAGRFSMPGTFTGAMRVTASNDGYVPATKTFSQSTSHVFSLEPIGPSANIAGAYALTLTADPACTNLPDEARIRTYSATIVRAPVSQTSFLATLSDARFFSIHNQASIGTAGDFVGFSFSISEANTYEWAGIVEQLRETTYVAVEGRAHGTFGPSGITAPLSGYFEYCPSERDLTGDRYAGCSATAAVRCDSRNHHITLVRR